MAEDAVRNGLFGRFRPQPRPDRAIADLAGRQHGVVALSQLRGLGMSTTAVHKQATTGLLMRVYPGVYAVGHLNLGCQGRWMAAVLACGTRAVVSHRTAAALHEIRRTDRPWVDVSAPGRAGRRIAGITEHSAATLTPAEITSVRAIPATSLARTLVDLAGVVPRRVLERAVEQAEVLRILDLGDVRRLLAQSPGRQTTSLREILAEPDLGRSLTRSELEERFLALCVDASLPAPQVNAWVGVGNDRFQVDFLWAAQRVVVETDGHAVHGTRRAFESDRRRDQLLTLAGWRVLRFTWRQVVQDAPHVAATVAGLVVEK